MIAAITLFVSFRSRARLEIAGLAALMLLITCTYVGQGLALARMVAHVFEDGALAAGDLAGPVALLVVLQVLRSVLIVLRDAWAPRVAAGVKEAVRERLTAKVLELGPGQTQRMRTGDLQAAVVDSVELLDPLIGRFLPTLFASVLGACLASAYVLRADPLVGVVVLVCALLTPLSKLAGARWIKERGDRWRVSYRTLLAENLDAVQGMATLKAFNASGRRGAELAVRAATFCRDSIGLMWAWCASSSIADLLVPIGTAAAVGFGAWHAASGDVSASDLFIILLLTRETFRPMQELSAAYHSAFSALPAARSVADLLALDPEVADTGRSPVVDSMPGSMPGLEWRDVGFGYPGRGVRVLDGLSLAVAPGERVAVVGPSGAGKSTLVALLLRHFDPETGSVRIGGLDVREMPLETLRSRIGVVAQDTYLFHGTVRENLLLARPEASEEELQSVLAAAQADAFVSALPQGLETVIGERGLKLSGGERQRLAIARALLKDAPVLVLDEPTSSIDAAHEAEITAALAELTRDRTTLVIAHRLSTIRDADRIVVMEAGRVVESGSHDDLLGRRGAYADLVASQTGAVL